MSVMVFWAVRDEMEEIRSSFVGHRVQHHVGHLPQRGVAKRGDRDQGGAVALGQPAAASTSRLAPE